MADEGKICEYQAGHAARMKIAESKVAENLLLASKRDEWRARWDRLALRAELIGARLAGQDMDEGVIDRDGNFHDIQWNPEDLDNEEFRIAAVTAVLERLGA